MAASETGRLSVEIARTRHAAWRWRDPWTWGATIVWIAWTLLTILLYGEFYMRVLHPLFLPFAFLLVVLAISFLSTLGLGLWQLLRGPKRLSALCALLASLAPILLMVIPCEYTRRLAEPRQVPRNALTAFAMMCGASLMEGQAAYLYPHRIETPHLIMVYDRLQTPQQDADTMEQHVTRLAAFLRRPLRAKILWVRGPLLGRQDISLFGLSLGSAESPPDWKEDHLDRHELAHAVIAEQCPYDADPPAVLIEGWAESQAGYSSPELACHALRLRASGNHLPLWRLVSPAWYHHNEGPAYDEGGPLVDFLLRRYGVGRFLQLYDTCRPRSFAADCQRVLGVSLESLNALFWNDMQHWWPRNEPALSLSIPTRPMPSPNARDYFFRAANAIQTRSEIAYLIAQPSSPALLVRKEAAVRKNSEALSILRRGFAFPFEETPVRAFQTILPYRQYYALASLLVLDAQVQAARGDWSQALQCDLDAVQLGQVIACGAPLAGMMNGIAYKKLARQDAQSLMPHLDSAAALAGARRMESILTLHVPYAQVLKEEKWGTAAGLLEKFHDPAWRCTLPPMLGVDTSATSMSKRALLSSYLRYTDRLIGAGRQNAPKPLPPLQEPILKAMTAGYLEAQAKDHLAQAQDEQLAIQLALRAYRLEHGRDPARLSDLVPSILRKLPDTSVAHGHEFMLRELKN